MTLPPYVVINDPDCQHREVLKKPAQEISFPITPEDQKIIQELEAKYDQEDNCAGLAAPQIGYNKRVIVFATPRDPIFKKWRPDLSDTMPKTIWINPSYKPVHPETHTDWEACFSVRNLAGPVPRFKEITYEAFTLDSKKIQGVARGFLARIIQHEVDHLNGTLFIDVALQDQVVTIEEYRERRKKELNSAL